MSIFLKPVQRYNPLDKEAPAKWYPVQYTVKLVNETEVAELVAEETTLNPMEALMAIRQLRKVVQRLLLDGKSVKLGNWGTFNITLSTEGAETAEALTANHVKRINVNFQAGDDMKNAMQKADFVWLNKISGLENAGSTESPDGEEEDRPEIENAEGGSPDPMQ